MKYYLWKASEGDDDIEELVQQMSSSKLRQMAEKKRNLAVVFFQKVKHMVFSAGAVDKKFLKWYAKFFTKLGKFFQTLISSIER